MSVDDQPWVTLLIYAFVACVGAFAMALRYSPKARPWMLLPLVGAGATAAIVVGMAIR